jgi:indolepyruvate ferredoxin oxidoreductase
MIFCHLGVAKQQDWPLLVTLARSAEIVRGYGRIKHANVARYRLECARIERAFGQSVAQAAE